MSFSLPGQILYATCISRWLKILCQLLPVSLGFETNSYHIPTPQHHILTTVFLGHDPGHLFRHGYIFSQLI